MKSSQAITIYKTEYSLRSYSSYHYPLASIKMNKIEDIAEYKFYNGIHKWSLNTTNSNLIGFQINKELTSIINDWNTYKPFADKYGLMFSYPEDYLSIYILISLVNNYEILSHPHTQESNSTLERVDLEYDLVRWRYTEEIHYDQDYNYKTYSEGFTKSTFQDHNDQRKLLKLIWDLTTKDKPNSKLYKLNNSSHIHQSVICGGNSDVHKCPNYFGVNSENQKIKIIELLSSNSKPKLENILSNCEFFITDYKGEDIGYARQMNIYSNKDINEAIQKIYIGFREFQNELVKMNKNCTNLFEYESKLNELEIKYGC